MDGVTGGSASYSAATSTSGSSSGGAAPVVFLCGVPGCGAFSTSVRAAAPQVNGVARNVLAATLKRCLEQRRAQTGAPARTLQQVVDLRAHRGVLVQNPRGLLDISARLGRRWRPARSRGSVARSGARPWARPGLCSAGRWPRPGVHRSSGLRGDRDYLSAAIPRRAQPPARCCTRLASSPSKAAQRASS